MNIERKYWYMEIIQLGSRHYLRSSAACTPSVTSVFSLVFFFDFFSFGGSGLVTTSKELWPVSLSASGSFFGCMLFFGKGLLRLAVGGVLSPVGLFLPGSHSLTGVSSAKRFRAGFLGVTGDAGNGLPLVGVLTSRSASMQQQLSHGSIIPYASYLLVAFTGSVTKIHSNVAHEKSSNSIHSFTSIRTPIDTKRTPKLQRKETFPSTTKKLCSAAESPQ